METPIKKTLHKQLITVRPTNFLNSVEVRSKSMHERAAGSDAGVQQVQVVSIAKKKNKKKSLHWIAGEEQTARRIC